MEVFGDDFGGKNYSSNTGKLQKTYVSLFKLDLDSLSTAASGRCILKRNLPDLLPCFGLAGGGGASGKYSFTVLQGHKEECTVLFRQNNQIKT